MRNNNNLGGTSSADSDHIKTLIINKSKQAQ